MSKTQTQTERERDREREREVPFERKNEALVPGAPRGTRSFVFSGYAPPQCGSFSDSPSLPCSFSLWIDVVWPLSTPCPTTSPIYTIPPQDLWYCPKTALSMKGVLESSNIGKNSLFGSRENSHFLVEKNRSPSFLQTRCRGLWWYSQSGLVEPLQLLRPFSLSLSLSLESENYCQTSLIHTPLCECDPVLVIGTSLGEVFGLFKDK